MKIDIEEYRGWDISFDIDSDSFHAYSNLFDTYKDRDSLHSLRKKIDEYIKENAEFKPVKIYKPESVNAPVLLTGIRKDGRFVYTDAKGKLQQFASYDEKEYYLYDSSLDETRAEIAKLISESNIIQGKLKVMRAYLKTKTITLKEYKKELGHE